MTREEAIEILKQFKRCLSDVVFDEKGSEAWQMAIKALSQEQDMTIAYLMGKYEDKEPCDDAISREAVNTLVDELARAISDERCHIPQRGRDTGHIMQDILELPSVTHKSGKWIIRDDLSTVRYYQCSECNEIDLDISNYCPNCGAKMESEE